MIPGESVGGVKAQQEGIRQTTRPLFDILPVQPGPRALRSLQRRPVSSSPIRGSYASTGMFITMAWSFCIVSM